MPPPLLPPKPELWEKPLPELWKEPPPELKLWLPELKLWLPPKLELCDE